MRRTSEEDGIVPDNDSRGLDVPSSHTFAWKREPCSERGLFLNDQVVFKNAVFAGRGTERHIADVDDGIPANSDI